MAPNIEKIWYPVGPNVKAKIPPTISTKERTKNIGPQSVRSVFVVAAQSVMAIVTAAVIAAA